MIKFFLITVLGLAIRCPAFAENKAPKLKPDKLVYDFGTVIGTENVTGTFKLTNEGEAALKFGEPQVSCGCTVASITPESLEPGQSAELEFTLNMPAARVRLNKEITVLSNDPKTPELTLIITGEHIPAFEITPVAFNLTIPEGAVTNLTARLTRIDGKLLSVHKLVSSKPWIKVHTDRRDEKSIDISLELKPDGQPRRLFEFVNVYSAETTVPIAMLQILGRVVGDIVVSPETIFWSITDTNQLSASALTTRYLKISISPGKEFEIKAATSSIPEVGVSVRKAGNSYELTAKLDRIPNNIFQGKILIVTSHPNQPILEVPLTIYVPHALADQLTLKGSVTE